MLRNRAMYAGEIAAAFCVSRPAISRHLRVLRESGLVSDELAGRERVYRLRLVGLAELEACLVDLHSPNGWDRRLLALETEVHRVKRARRRAQTRAHENHSKEKSA